MIYTTKANATIETVKTELESKAKEVGFGLLKSYEFQTILEGKGFPIEKEIIVFEICNPRGAQQALTKITEISVFLPCRISLYEQDGITTLSTIGFDDMLSSVEVDDEFKIFMGNLFEDLKKVMHSWDG